MDIKLKVVTVKEKQELYLNETISRFELPLAAG